MLTAFAPGTYPRLFSGCSGPRAPPLCRAASISATSSIQPQNLLGSPPPTTTQPVIGSEPTSTASFRCVARSVTS